VPLLLPAQYVRLYVRRNKTDRSDAEALVEARRCGGILPVPVKTAEQQALQSLHRVRAQWQTARTARINVIRSLLREYGLPLRAGAVTIRRTVPALLDDAAQPLPPVLRQVLWQLLEEVRELEGRVKALDRQLGAVADGIRSRGASRRCLGSGRSWRPVFSAACRTFTRSAEAGVLRVGWGSRRAKRPAARGNGVGASASAVTLTFGRSSRTALSVLFNAQRRARAHAHRLTALQRWVVQAADRRGSNKAVTALANKLARIIWAVWRGDVDFSVAVRSSPAAV
jgi:transposase